MLIFLALILADSSVFSTTSSKDHHSSPDPLPPCFTSVHIPVLISFVTLFICGSAGSLLLCAALLWLQWAAATASRLKDSDCGGSSLGAQALRRAPRLQLMGPRAPAQSLWHAPSVVGTVSPAWAGGLIHCTTREVPVYILVTMRLFFPLPQGHFWSFLSYLGTNTILSEYS